MRKKRPANVECPSCGSVFACASREPGAAVRCPDCDAHLRISARATLLHVDRIQDGRPAGAEPSWPQLQRFVTRHRNWFIAFMILGVLAPGLIPIFLLIVGILVFNHFFSDEPTEVPAEPAAPSPRTAPESQPVRTPAPGAPRTSKLAVLALLMGLVLLVGGAAFALLGGVIAEEVLYLSTAEMAGAHVAMAAGLVPALLALFFAHGVRRRCNERGLKGSGMAASATLMSLLFLGGLGYAASGSAENMVRWRAIGKLAARQDARTLDALETELAHPASSGSRDQATRLLVAHAPERAVGVLDSGSSAARVAVLRRMYHSEHRAMAVPAARRILERSPHSREARVARRYVEQGTSHRGHGPRAASSD